VSAVRFCPSEPIKDFILKGLAIILANPFLFKSSTVLEKVKILDIFADIYTYRRNDMIVYIILGITLIYVAVIIYLYLKSERSACCVSLPL